MRFHRPGYNELAELNSEVSGFQSLAAFRITRFLLRYKHLLGDYCIPVDIGAVDSNGATECRGRRLG